MTELLGYSLFEVWQKLCSAIDEKYDMEKLWNTGGKRSLQSYEIEKDGHNKYYDYADVASIIVSVA